MTRTPRLRAVPREPAARAGHALGVRAAPRGAPARSEVSIARALAAALALAALLVGALLVGPRGARADDDQAIHRVVARVVVETSVVRSGPGASYARVHVARRGDTFPVRERATRGYWFRVELPDGTSGWIQGDTVYNTETSGDDGRFLPWLFAPPPLPVSSGEVAVAAGYMNGGGTLSFRPSLLLKPSFGLELNGTVAVSAGGRLAIVGGGPIINLFPDAPIVPYAVLGGGVAFSEPNADTFILQGGVTTALWGGFGLRFCFRYRITLRLEARTFAFYTPDRLVVREEFSGGFTVFF
jgi:uncharacterized protein YgiM (DUF1202 family)